MCDSFEQLGIDNFDTWLKMNNHADDRIGPGIPEARAELERRKVTLEEVQQRLHDEITKPFRDKINRLRSELAAKEREIVRLKEQLCRQIKEADSERSACIVKEVENSKLLLEPTSGICIKYQIQNCGVCDNIHCSDNTSAAKDAIRTLESTLRSEQTKREDLQSLNSKALEMLKQMEWLSGEFTVYCPVCGDYGENPEYARIHDPDCALAALIKEMEAVK